MRTLLFSLRDDLISLIYLIKKERERERERIMAGAHCR